MYRSPSLQFRLGSAQSINQLINQSINTFLITYLINIVLLTLCMYFKLNVIFAKIHHNKFAVYNSAFMPNFRRDFQLMFSLNSQRNAVSYSYYFRFIITSVFGFLSLKFILLLARSDPQKIAHLKHLANFLSFFKSKFAVLSSTIDLGKKQPLPHYSQTFLNV